MLVCQVTRSYFASDPIFSMCFAKDSHPEFPAISYCTIRAYEWWPTGSNSEVSYILNFVFCFSVNIFSEDFRLFGKGGTFTRPQSTRSRYCRLNSPAKAPASIVFKWFPGRDCDFPERNIEKLGLLLLMRYGPITIGFPIINLRRSSDRLRFIMRNLLHILGL